MIRILAGAVVAAMAMAGAATAETGQAAASRCGNAPTAPTAPDGATVNQRALQAALAEYETWRQAAEANLACRHEEATELRAAAEARAAEYNAALAVAREVSAAFQAANEAFNARPARSRR